MKLNNTLESLQFLLNMEKNKIIKRNKIKWDTKWDTKMKTKCASSYSAITCWDYIR